MACADLSHGCWLIHHTAVFVTMIAIATQSPATGDNKYSLWPKEGTTFNAAFLSVTNVIFAFGKNDFIQTSFISEYTNRCLIAGHVCFFTFISEMEKPEEFPKALALLQVSDITMYIVTSVVIYRFGGKQVASPALGSAGPLARKIAFGLAIPTVGSSLLVDDHTDSSTDCHSWCDIW